MTRVDERTLVRKRHLKIEPTLGDTAYKITGIAPGYDGHLIAKALQERADRFPNRIDGENSGRSQRTLDALTALCQDYLDEDHSGQDDLAGTKPNKAAGGSVTVFMEMNQAATTGGELGASLAAGPRVGPDTLERILCGGAVSVVGLDERGRPVTVTNRARRIPPAIRDLVLQRDGGCVIEGCRSRYRLEPHHIHRYSHGGDHDPDNLATLCWAHHHVAIHGYGHRIDPTSPPQRRRLLRPGAPDPPIPIAA